MWKFHKQKKEETIDSLRKECHLLYKSFVEYSHLAHYQSYYEFKKEMKINFQTIHHCIEKENNEKLVHLLLIRFKEQLLFFQDHTFSANEHNFNQFKEKNFPYREKIEQMMAQSMTALTPIKDIVVRPSIKK